MKSKIIMFLLSLLPLSLLNSNPVKLHIFSEIMFDSTGWKLELNSFLFQHSVYNNLNGWYLESDYGKAYFKYDLNLDSLNYVIDKDGLSSSFEIDRNGDIITVYDSAGYIEDQIIFGDMPWSLIAAPPIGWSICVAYGWAGSTVLYFDKSPTIGSENDTAGTLGWIEGFVKDSVGNPIDSVQVIYDNEGGMANPDYIFTLTDSKGFYKIKYQARVVYMFVLKEGFLNLSDTVQIWPDSIVTKNFKLNRNITSISDNTTATIKFDLFQNYPNPFNPETFINYTINTGTKGSALVQLRVYDLMGRVIATLVNEYKPSGHYSIRFNGIVNGKYLSSGVYFYSLKAGNYFSVKKMILLR